MSNPGDQSVELTSFNDNDVIRYLDPSILNEGQLRRLAILHAHDIRTLRSERDTANSHIDATNEVVKRARKRNRIVWTVGGTVIVGLIAGMDVYVFKQGEKSGFEQGKLSIGRRGEATSTEISHFDTGTQGPTATLELPTEDGDEGLFTIRGPDGTLVRTEVVRRDESTPTATSKSGFTTVYVKLTPSPTVAGTDADTEAEAMVSHFHYKDGSDHAGLPEVTDEDD